MLCSKVSKCRHCKVFTTLLMLLKLTVPVSIYNKAVLIQMYAVEIVVFICKYLCSLLTFFSLTSCGRNLFSFEINSVSYFPILSFCCQIHCCLHHSLHIFMTAMHFMAAKSEVSHGALLAHLN